MGRDWSGTTTAASPTDVEAAAVNTWLFNEDTVDKVLAHLMTRGHEGGRRRPARQDDHLRQEPGTTPSSSPSGSTPTTRTTRATFARVITSRREYAQSLIDDFSSQGQAPHIAISVDMLDTGIDIPEVVNLVFFKLVRSKTKFWQMIGRGTRLCPDLFGPGEDKSSSTSSTTAGTWSSSARTSGDERGRAGRVARQAAVHHPPGADRGAGPHRSRPEQVLTTRQLLRKDAGDCRCTPRWRR